MKSETGNLATSFPGFYEPITKTVNSVNSSLFTLHHGFDHLSDDDRRCEPLHSIAWSFVEAKRLSVGPPMQLEHVPGVSPTTWSTCFHRVCAALGVSVPYFSCRVSDLTDDTALMLRSEAKFAKIHYEFYSNTDARNHVTLVSPTTATMHLELASPSGYGFTDKVIGVADLEKFFDRYGEFCDVLFFSGDRDSAEFGEDVPLPSSTGPRSFPRGAPREASVSDPDARHGAANVTGGVVRPRRRVVGAKSKFSPTGAVAKSYLASAGVRFNNLNEIFLDTISREYAQEILEQVFSEWAIDLSDPDAVKYAEDLVWAFLIATTASNKANYTREFEVPHRVGVVVVNFEVFSRVLAEGHGVTRRQFSRGVADDQRRYIREPENIHLLPNLASRIGCDPQMATLAFDGSTHCTGLTTAELSFTKLLEARNLFEDDSLLAEGASSKLMQGMSSGPRSIISR